MKTLQHTDYYDSVWDRFRLYYLTDMHIGARVTDEAVLRRDIEIIRQDPYARWIGGGDMIDCIARKGDKRYNESELASWLHGRTDVIQHQMDYLLGEFLTPIANKCIGFVKGNHEQVALQYYDRNVYWEVVKHLATIAGKSPQSVALGYNGFVEWFFKRGCASKKYNKSTWKFTTYVSHGFGGGRLPGGHALALKRVLDDFSCDLAMLGHRHVRHYADSKVVCPNGKVWNRIAVFVPSYRREYGEHTTLDKEPFDSYVESKGLPATHLGTLPVSVLPSQRKFEVTMANTPGLMPHKEKTQRYTVKSLLSLLQEGGINASEETTVTLPTEMVTSLQSQLIA